MRIVYVAHPVGASTPDGVARNIARAKRWYRWLSNSQPDCAFCANWIVEVEVHMVDGADVLDGDEHAARARGLARDDAMIARCDEIWLVGGNVSSGMQRGLDVAEAHNLGVVDLTPMGPEPPAPGDEAYTMIVPAPLTIEEAAAALARSRNGQSRFSGEF